jgi:hypothetical protein
VCVLDTQCWIRVQECVGYAVLDTCTRVCWIRSVGYVYKRSESAAGGAVLDTYVCVRVCVCVCVHGGSGATTVMYDMYMLRFLPMCADLWGSHDSGCLVAKPVPGTASFAQDATAHQKQEG